MAVQRIGVKTSSPAKFKAMVNTIAEEILRPLQEPPKRGAPRVLAEDQPPPSRYVHYYVVWDGFEGTDWEERSRVVFEAIKQGVGEKEALRTTVAMGLTRDEAKEMFPHLPRA
jgi:hypothetical protein